MRRVVAHQTFLKTIVVIHALLVGMVSIPIVAIAADPPKPAKKDSSAGLKPKNAVLTTSVEPAEAKPGEMVTFKVTAKLDPGTHIYGYSKTEMPGPIRTSFDFFDPAGLKIEGDWSASKEVEKHKDPYFADLDDLEYHEDEVTWSIKLKVPDDAEAGKKTLHCQARYMVCNQKSCSVPGRWTLPEAVLTVLPAKRQGNQLAAVSKEKFQQQAATALSVYLIFLSDLEETVQEEQAVTAASPKPSKREFPAALKPKNAVLTTSVEPAEAKPGEMVTFKVTAKLAPGAHIYKYSKDQTQGPGPSGTNFDFFDPAGLEVEGEWVASKEAEKHRDPNFPKVDFVEFHEGEVTWSTKLKIPTATPPGKKTLRCQAHYLVCTAKSCSVLGQWTLPDAVLTVLPASGQGNQSAAVSPVEQKVESTPKIEAKESDAATPALTPTAASETSTAGTPPTSAVAQSEIAQKAQQDAERRHGLNRSLRVAQSEIAQKAQQGLLPFLIASALGGLFALVMPCVWPMVPITVNFFVKQGQGPEGKGKATGLACIYCLSIIGVFTAVGVLFSFFFSASSLQTLANNPWLNLGVAALFLAFGLSLLGLFELRLPSFLLNASAQGESRGGLIGVVFMALTLTITSFTCTFPVVGGLLVMAAGGNFFYPIVGLATFATVLAFPFFLLALSPGLISRMPRSGDWMNAVKVVGGLVEIGAALKFINTAELGYVTAKNAWFDAQVVLTSWIALSVVCGFYLLGLFRTDHDHDEVRVGPGRLVMGALFLGLALYMAPAMFGRPPQSLVWDRLIVGILPPDSAEFNAEGQVATNPGESSAPRLKDISAVSTDPAQAEREEKKAHGVLWGLSFDQARELAVQDKKPILIDFTGVNCANCRLMERTVFPRPEVISLLKRFVTVQLYTDYVQIDNLTTEQRANLAEQNQERLLKLANEATNPFYVVLSPSGEVLGKIGGYNEPPEFVDFLTKALAKLPENLKVTQSTSVGD
jgi:thiol:disulfide interchange protein